MFKTLFAAAVITAGMVAPALADDMMMCDDAHMMKAEEAAKMMKGDKMDMAMKDVDAAKMAMKDGKMDDCKMALEKVMKDAM
jgi:archaellum component FlaG (FlaF/FlaG flagellin family)